MSPSIQCYTSNNITPQNNTTTIRLINDNVDMVYNSLDEQDKLQLQLQLQPKSKNNRCLKCKRRGLHMQCNFCEFYFCYSCFVPEVHNCINIDKCKSIKTANWSKSILNGRCTGEKITKI